MIEVKRYRARSGSGNTYREQQVPALVGPGRGDKLKALVLGYPIRLMILPATEARYMTDLRYGKAQALYPIKRAVRVMRKFARRGSYGINKDANQFLKQIEEDLKNGQ